MRKKCGKQATTSNSFPRFRSPYFARDPVGFSISVFLSMLITVAYVLNFKAFTTIYVCFCTNIASFADDISLNIVRANKNIDQKMSLKKELKQIVELHLHCYRYGKFALHSICVELESSAPNY